MPDDDLTKPFVPPEWARSFFEKSQRELDEAIDNYAEAVRKATYERLMNEHLGETLARDCRRDN